MGLNRKRGRIPNNIKQRAIECVNKSGELAYHYACYDCAFLTENDRESWTKMVGNDCFEKAIKEQANYDYPLIDCIVKELKKRKLWENENESE